jgi:DNA-binding winged helix-turn-helix (wHTH) protein/TolB-like protein
MSYWDDFKRRHAKSGQRSGYAFSGFLIDDRRRILFRAGGERIPLPPKVFDTLLYFVERSGQLLDKRELLEAIWPNVVVEENNLNQAISTLRRVLGEIPGQHRFIVTEPGRGYRFVADVQNANEAFRADVAVKGFMKRGYVAVAIAAVLVLATAVWYGLREVEPRLPYSIAVLPFDNESPDPDKAYMARSIYEEVVDQLGKIPELQVVTPRMFGLRYEADSGLPLSDIAEELGVSLIMGGSVRYADDQIRATFWLLDTSSNRHTWSETYTNNADDPFAIESGIARDVAFQLSIELSPEEEARIRRLPTDSWQARSLYLEAVALGRSVRSLEPLNRALEIDPNFSAAYAFRAWIHTSTLINSVNGNVDTSSNWVEIRRQIVADVDNALSRDPDAFLAYRARGTLRMREWRWKEARRDLDHLRSLYPNFPAVLRDYTWFSFFSGAYEEAISTAKHLRDIAKDAPFRGYSLGLAYAFAGQPEAAKRALQKANLSGDGALVAALYIGLMEARLGNNRAAEEQFTAIELDLNGKIDLSISPGAAVGYDLIGRNDKAEELSGRILNPDSADVDIDAGTRAMAYLALGDPEGLAESLWEAIDKINRWEPDGGFFNLMMIKHNVMDHPMLEQPRFQRLREQLQGF